MSSEEGEIGEEEGEIIVNPPTGSSGGPPPPNVPLVASPPKGQLSGGGPNNFPPVGANANIPLHGGGGPPPPHRGPPARRGWGGRGGRGGQQVSPFPRQPQPPQPTRIPPRQMSMTGGVTHSNFPAARSNSFTGYTTPRSGSAAGSGGGAPGMQSGNNNNSSGANPPPLPMGRPTDPRFPPNDPRNRNNPAAVVEPFRSFDTPGAPGDPPQQPSLGRMSSYSSLADPNAIESNNAPPPPPLNAATNSNNNNPNSRGGEAGFDFRQVQRTDSFHRAVGGPGGSANIGGPLGPEERPGAFHRNPEQGGGGGFPRSDAPSFGAPDFRRDTTPFRGVGEAVTNEGNFARSESFGAPDFRREPAREPTFRGGGGEAPAGEGSFPRSGDGSFPRGDSFGAPDFRRETPFREAPSGDFGETAPVPPFRRGEFAEPEDPANFRPHQRSGSFRGAPGRRPPAEFGGGFRGGTVRNFSNVTNPPVGSESSYYGPATGSNNPPNGPADFTRWSPSQRGRQIVRPGGPAPPLLRPGGPPPHRRADPRFAKDLPPPPPEAVRSGGMEEPPFYRSRGDDTNTDPLRQWQSHSRTEPPQPSPRVPPLDAARTAAKPPPVVAPLAPPTEPSSEPEEPAALVTNALGEEQVERAEEVVSLISELMGKSNLKSDTKGESTIPATGLILGAMSRLATSIKATEKQAARKQGYVEEAAATEKAAQDAAIEVKAKLEEEEKARQQAARVRAEVERKQKQDAWLQEREEQEETEIATFMTAKTKGFEIEEAKTLEDVEVRVAEANNEEQLRQQEEMDSLIAAAKESFDGDIAKAQRSYDRAVNNEKKTKARILATEAEQKAETAESPPASEEHTSADLVAQILAANQRRAAEAHLCPFALVSEDECHEQRPCFNLENILDPVEKTSFADWAQRTNQVTGLSDALYNEPSESPFFKQNEDVHALIAPLVKEYVRDTQTRLTTHWTELAEEYEFRRETYKKRHGSHGSKGKQKRSASVVRHSIFGTRQEAKPITEEAASAATAAATAAAPTARTSSNPYRRPRRGNEIRSEYEQEQIMKELSAKEALEKRIASGRSDVPRQVGRVERQLAGTFVNTFKAQRVDVIAQETDYANTTVWSDMEKCIFLDRFLQHPKDFRKIASFLRNKTTRDCVAFYYDSKQSLPYKDALREHIMRRKRRGDYHIWDATIQASISVGAIVEAGPNEDRPVLFHLPKDDNIFTTRLLHPLKRDVLDAMEVERKMTVFDEGDESFEPEARRIGRKRRRHQLFILDPQQSQFLKNASPEVATSKVPSRSPVIEPEIVEFPAADLADRDEVSGPSRKAPQKWTAAEKKIFLETLEKYGRNWDMLSDAVGTKSISQIKNYYYDYKKQAGKLRPEKKLGKSDMSVKGRNDQDDMELESQEQQEPTQDSVAGEVPEEAQQLPVDQETRPQQQLPVHLSSQHTPDTSKHGPQLPVQQAPVPSLQQSLELQGVPPEVLPRQRELEHAMSRSGATTPDTIAADLWAQAQQQALLHQHSQTQIREAAARQLLLESQNHSLLSSLLPWMSSQQVQHPNQNRHDWSDNQQLHQSLMQLQHQQQHQHHQPLTGLNSSHLGMALAGINGLTNPGAASFGGASSADDATQQLLLQRFMALQREAPSNSTADAMSLLARAGSGHNSGRNSFPGSDSSR